MAKQIDSSLRIADPPDKGSGRDRLAAIEPHIDVQEHIGKIGNITATRLAAASQPVSELGRRMERIGEIGHITATRLGAAIQPLSELGSGIERLQRGLAGPGVLAGIDKRMEAFVDIQERIGTIGDITATRLAAASQPVSELGRRMERIGEIGHITATRLGAAIQPLSELGRGIERLSPSRLAGPLVPRPPEVPRVTFARQIGSQPARQPARPAAAGLELTKPYGNSQRNASLELTLAAIEPALAVQFRAVTLRSQERGPDWLTQAAASCRKLLLGLIHTAAPDELVLLWVQDRRAQLDQNGRPTRRTKIDWLCRSIQNRAYRRFVRGELNSALEVLELCNQAVHVNEFPEFEESFTSAIIRVEFAICHIARLSGRRRST